MSLLRASDALVKPGAASQLPETFRLARKPVGEVVLVGADLGVHREAALAVEIPERSGRFLRFCEVIGRRAVTEINHR